jgi:hypothetical protein
VEPRGADDSSEGRTDSSSEPRHFWEELAELADERGYRLKRSPATGPYLTWNDDLTREGLRPYTWKRLWQAAKQATGYEPARRSTWKELFPAPRPFETPRAGPNRPYAQTQIGPFGPAPLGKLPNFPEATEDAAADAPDVLERIERWREKQSEQAEELAQKIRRGESGSVSSLRSRCEELAERVSAICAGVEAEALSRMRGPMKVWLVEAERAAIRRSPNIPSFSSFSFARAVAYWKRGPAEFDVLSDLHGRTATFWKVISCGNVSAKMLGERASRLLHTREVPDALERSTGDLLLHFYENEVLPRILRARELDDKRTVFEEALLRLQHAPVSEKAKAGKELPYSDESMLTSAESNFRSDAKWHKWGPFIVNRYIEFERKGISKKSDMTDKIREALREERSKEIHEAGHDLANFTDTQLNRVMDHHNSPEGFKTS